MNKIDVVEEFCNERWSNGKTSFNPKRTGQKNIQGIWYDNINQYKLDIYNEFSNKLDNLKISND